MKSDVIHLTKNEDGMILALDQAERTAAFKQLSPKNAIRLRLLTEEMMGMFRALTGEVEADFWIEDSEKEFSLHLLTETQMTGLKRDQLLAASTSGENVSAKGIMGKIRDIIERALEPSVEGAPRLFGGGWYAPNMAGASMSNMGALEAEMWSLNQYRESLKAGENGEAWDELEKSVVANLADEVRIGIVGGKVEMVIFKTFD